LFGFIDEPMIKIFNAFEGNGPRHSACQRRLHTQLHCQHGFQQLTGEKIIFLKKKRTHWGSVADPSHFGMDPDPDLRIHASD
jgi:hypothetical protein